jgi:hypothetical protein
MRIGSREITLVEGQTSNDCYSTGEFGRIVGRAEFTAREWARLAWINAEKRESGRGPHASRVISHAELLRFQCHGLLPAVTAIGTAG